MGLLEDNSVPAPAPPADDRAYHWQPDGGVAADGTPIGNYHPIPPAYRYVLAEDTFFSGWGGAKGRKNVIVVPCADEAQVAIAKGRIRDREEMSAPVVTAQVEAFDSILYSLVPGWAQPRVA